MKEPHVSVLPLTAILSPSPLLNLMWNVLWRPQLIYITHILCDILDNAQIFCLTAWCLAYSPFYNWFQWPGTQWVLTQYWWSLKRKIKNHMPYSPSWTESLRHFLHHWRRELPDSSSHGCVVKSDSGFVKDLLCVCLFFTTYYDSRIGGPGNFITGFYLSLCKWLFI